MDDNFDLLPNDDNIHSLLEPPQPAYTNITVQRAFIVWLHCGQRNKFKHVCNYFHHLEHLESQLTPEKRLSSRMHEFNLFYKQPPVSDYLTTYFPGLYCTKSKFVNIKQINEIKIDGCVFNLEGFCDLKIDKYITNKDILKTSKIIRTYCKAHSKTLKNLLLEFKDYTKKTDSPKSFVNITRYIKNKYTEDELKIYNKLPKDFDFLHDNFDEEYMKMKNKLTIMKEIKVRDNRNNTDDKSLHNIMIELKKDVINNNNKIKILINDVKRNEIINLFRRWPQPLIEITNNDITCNNVQLTEITGADKMKYD